jgi:thiamine-monophosphate kinase
MAREFDLIRRHFAALTPPGPQTLRGVGDDCALLRPPADREMAVSVDTLVEGIHWPMATPAHAVGWKALACGLSDLAAAGAEPAWATLALTHPDANDDWLAGFAAGFAELAQRHGVELVGGDTTRGPLAMTVQVAGYLAPGTHLGRDGARPGDAVFVSGWPGRASAGLARVLADQRTAEDPLVTALEYPEPRVALGRWLAGRATACIDVSDGLAGDLGHILQASGVGARLDLDALPRASALAATGHDDQVSEHILNGGDDYELCFTLDSAEAERVTTATQRPLTRIGEITAARGLWAQRGQGEAHPLASAGYRHFEPPKAD